MVDLLPGRADIKIVSWPGERNAGDLLCCINIDGFAVIVAQNLNRRVSLITQAFRTPLAQPVRAGDTVAVAVLSKERLTHTGAREVSGERCV